jgi:hypothetical protein
MNKPNAPENGVNPDAQEGYAVPASQDHHSELVQFLSAVLEDCFKTFKEKMSSFFKSQYKIFITYGINLDRNSLTRK